MVKKLSDLTKELSDLKRIGDTYDPVITGISHDTRVIQPGNLFICISGFKQDGHDFAEKAVQSGAVALVVQRPLDKLGKIPQIIVSNARKTEAILTTSFYDHPSRKMKVIGITGTNGKTTTTYMIESILKSAGCYPGVVGTVNYRYAGNVIDARNTTPSSLELNELMSQMVKFGCSHLVMEVSSHALAQGRVDTVDFDYAIFTHITRDHLDFHETMEKYLEAKCLLFSKIGHDFDKGFPKKSIINMDDAHFETVMKASTVPVVTYGMNAKAEVRAETVDAGSQGLQFMLWTPKGNIIISLKLAGVFNVYNALAAVAVSLAMDISLEKIKEGLETLESVPGRFQSIYRGQGFMVIVDYAHTDDALINLLKGARQISKGKIIVVFGAGGDRDRGKRPLMGEAAAKLADELIITSDNPRSEDPTLIALDIEIGVKRVPQVENRYKIILDRGEAIKVAIQSAQAGDTVVIAGKGHENYQVFADRTIHFDDTETAAKYIDEIVGNTKIGTTTN